MLAIKHMNLKGNWVELEPLSPAHHNELYTVAQDEQIWTYNGSKGFGDKFYSWFAEALKHSQHQHHLPFVVRRLSDKKVLGSTRFHEIELKHKRLTIGYTWYIPEVWGTYVNPECKYLLLRHAFETLDINRVQFTADVRNARSRAAIKKLGALEEGCMRHHMVYDDGYIRDTALYSIIRPDWPSVKMNLEQRLNQFSSK